MRIVLPNIFFFGKKRFLENRFPGISFLLESFFWKPFLGTVSGNPFLEKHGTVLFCILHRAVNLCLGQEAPHICVGDLIGLTSVHVMSGSIEDTMRLYTKNHFDMWGQFCMSSADLCVTSG